MPLFYSKLPADQANAIIKAYSGWAFDGSDPRLAGKDPIKVLVDTADLFEQYAPSLSKLVDNFVPQV